MSNVAFFCANLAPLGAASNMTLAMEEHSPSITAVIFLPDVRRAS